VNLLPVGAQVRLVGYPDSATIRAVHVVCPHQGCRKPAYTVRRDPGQFPTWPSDDGLLHAEQVEPVERPELDELT